jgi:hypothetical protein
VPPLFVSDVTPQLCNDLSVHAPSVVHEFTIPRPVQIATPEPPDVVVGEDSIAGGNLADFRASYRRVHASCRGVASQLVLGCISHVKLFTVRPFKHMKISRRIASSASVLAVVFGTSLAAQNPAPAPAVKFPAQSPTSTLTQEVGLTKIEVTYARPGVKGRRIFGGTEAFGRVWRTGANTATKITFSTAVKFGGADVPAGSYALYTIPNENEWTIILNKVTGQWGAYTYKQENDLVRVKANPVKLAQPVETFTIDINDIRDQSATLNLIWENTRVPVRLEFDVAGTLMPQVEALMASDAKKTPQQYYNSAVFYYENGGDLKKALSWIEAATNNDKPAFYMMHWKAKILAKLGNADAAKVAAEKSKQLAVVAEGPQSPFVKMNNDLVAILK